MFQSLKTYFFYGKTYCSVWYDLDMENAAQPYLFSCRAIRKGSEIKVKDCKKYKNLSELSIDLKNNSHIHLTLSGKKILSKIIIDDKEKNAEDLLVEAFPNMDFDQFFYSIIRQKYYSIIHICRKELLKNILPAFEENGINIINFSLGVQNLPRVLQAFPPQTFQIDTTKIGWDGKEINSLSQGKEVAEDLNYTFEGKNYSINYLIPLSSFQYYLFSAENNYTNLDTFQRPLLRRFREKVFFRKYLMATCVFFLSILLVNYLIFDYQYKSLQQLKNNYQNELALKETLAQNKKDLKNKNKIVAELQRFESSQVSFYINQIINITPPEILFDEINFQPLSSIPKQNHPLDLQEKLIEISGTSTDKSKFNQWVDALEQITWVHKIEILQYINIPKGSEFKLKLLMKDAQ